MARTSFRGWGGGGKIARIQLETGKRRVVCVWGRRFASFRTKKDGRWMHLIIIFPLWKWKKRDSDSQVFFTLPNYILKGDSTLLQSKHRLIKEAHDAWTRTITHLALQSWNRKIAKTETLTALKLNWTELFSSMNSNKWVFKFMRYQTSHVFAGLGSWNGFFSSYWELCPLSA